MLILLVEDDRALREGLASLLTQSGYEVHTSKDGSEALVTLLNHEFDLAIVDLGLPGLDGLDVVRSLRRRRMGLPVLIITARGSLKDRITGLDVGADDFMVKPFEMAELEARVRALLRRQRAGRESEIRIGALKFQPGNPEIMLGETTLELPPSELALLELLTRSQGTIISKEQIARRVARNDQPLSNAAIEILVHRLRRKLSTSGVAIRALRGFGYLLEADEDR